MGREAARPMTKSGPSDRLVIAYREGQNSAGGEFFDEPELAVLDPSLTCHPVCH